MNRIVDPPCYLCAVRADIGCKHRPPSGDKPIAVDEPTAKEDRRARGRTASFWGKDGNPTEREFAAMAVHFRKRMT